MLRGWADGVEATARGCGCENEGMGTWPQEGGMGWGHWVRLAGRGHKPRGRAGDVVASEVGAATSVEGHGLGAVRSGQRRQG